MAATSARRTWTKTRFKTRGLHHNGMVEIGQIQSEIPQIPHKKICGNGDRCCGNAKGWNYAGAVGILLGCSLLCIWKIEYKIHVQVLKYWANCPIKMSQVASKYVVDS